MLHEREAALFRCLGFCCLADALCKLFKLLLLCQLVAEAMRGVLQCAFAGLVEARTYVRDVLKGVFRPVELGACALMVLSNRELFYHGLALE